GRRPKSRTCRRCLRLESPPGSRIPGLSAADVRPVVSADVCDLGRAGPSAAAARTAPLAAETRGRDSRRFRTAHVAHPAKATGQTKGGKGTTVHSEAQPPASWRRDGAWSEVAQER